MNIYITGASGTGKTTLATELSRKLDLPVATSVARTSPYKMGTWDNQKYISDAVNNQCHALDEHIVTRTPLDVLAFTTVWRYDTHEDRMRSAEFVTKRPVILYCPSYWAPEDDGFRPTDIEDHYCVDRVIREFLEYSGADFYTVLNEPVKQRSENAIKFIRRVKQNATVHL